MADFEYPGQPPITTGDRTGSGHLAWLQKLTEAVNRTNQINAYVLALNVGGVSDPLNFCTADSFAASESTPSPNMHIAVSGGIGFLRGVPLPLVAGFVSPAFVAPSASPRWDFVGIDAETLALVVQTGEEGVAGPPTPPDPDSTTPPLFPVCAVYHRVGETHINTADDSTNGYIVDLRPIPTA